MKDSQCMACGSYGLMDRCHIQTRGSTGNDFDEKHWIPMCRLCHRIQGNDGWNNFIERYPHLKDILLDKGFKIIEEFVIKKLRKT